MTDNRNGAEMQGYGTSHIEGAYRVQCKKSRKIEGAYPLNPKGNYDTIASYKALPLYRELKNKENDGKGGRTWNNLKKYKPIMDRLILDIDSDNLETALTTTREIMQELGYYKEYIDVYFSGSKGFHAEMKTEELDIIDITADKPKDSCRQYEEFLNYFNDKYDEVDTSLKDAGTRLIRKHHTKHEKTGNYKILVDVDANLDTIVANSKANKDMVEPATKILPRTAALKLLNDFNKPIGKPTEKSDKEKLSDWIDGAEHIPEATDYNIFTEVYNDLVKAYTGKRHNTIFAIGTALNGYVDKKELKEIYKHLKETTDIEESTNAEQSFYDAFDNDNERCNMGGLYNRYIDKEVDLTNFIRLSKYLEKNYTPYETKIMKKFSIGNDKREYEVEATLYEGKYSKIEIKELFEQKNFSFVFDMYNNVCKLVYSNKMRFEFKYTYNQGGFKIQSETEFKKIQKDVNDLLGISIPNGFKYSLSAYLSNLYNEIEKTNTADIEQNTNINIDIDKKEIVELINRIRSLFEGRKRNDVEIGRRLLSKLLTDFYGVILRKYIGTLFIIEGNGYEPTSHDDLMNRLTNLFGKNFIHDNDLKNAIGYISDRLEPIPNIIKFKNVLFDMDEIQVYETDKPIFTVLNIPYNYNPNAKSTMMKEFLRTTFARNSDEETAEAIKGIKQLCGYLFTSGNSLEILPIFTGKTGAGKSTLLNIITGIFGKDKISGISLQSLENDIHASSGFIGKHLNIIRDSDNSEIKNNSVLKNWTGNEGYPINPKFKELFDLPPEEVPKPILACNTMPVFKVTEDAVVRRLIIIEFQVSITKKGKDIKDLDKKILNNTEEVEWFIYESIQAYKQMIENDETFIFKITAEETKELMEKHTHPMNHIIRKLILKHDPKEYDDDMLERDWKNDGIKPIIFTDDLADAILFVSEKEGNNIPLNKHGKIDKRNLLEVIREEFDLHDGEIVKNKHTGKYENHRDYKARQQRLNELNKKCYPNLIATDKYWNVLKEVEILRKEKIENNQSKLV